MKNFTKEDVEAIRSSGLFDEEWYLEQYPDVKALGMDPAEHYLWLGARLGRNPSEKFDTDAYWDTNADVRSKNANPLLHYALFGRHEGREIADALAKVPRSAASNREVLSSRTRNPLAVLPPPAIIVPVYNAPDETEDCIRSVLKHTAESVRLILIDDASSDPHLKEVLACYADIPNVTVVRNETNLGFTGTINRGIGLAGRADVVFLNSDTKVTPLWLRNLQLAAYSDERIATATPLSNNAGAFSAPEIGKNNPLPLGLDIDDCARLVMRNSRRLYPRVPTGNGFCMYVRRACIDEIGTLDAEAFPRGYGEENDFCMRAGRAGWVHVIDDSTLIYHVRSASFGDEKTPLMKQGRAIIDQRYPEYTKRVREFIDDPVVELARKNIGGALDSRDSHTRPRFLYVISTRTGGTPQTNEDLMAAVSDRIEPFVLHSDSRKLTLYAFQDGQYIEYETRRLLEPIRAFPHRSEEYDAVVHDWLLRYGFELVHIRHIGWHGLGLVDEAYALDIPIVFSFHDFYTVCPTIKLLDEKMQYCAGRCTPGPGLCRMELWNTEDYASLKHAAVYRWREQIEPVLHKCSLFITTSESARAQVLSGFPSLQGRPFEVIPHGRDFTRFDHPKIQIMRDEKLKILVPGNISIAKGGGVVSYLGKKASDIGIELHILGKVARNIDISEGIILHGQYDREDFVFHAQRIKPHIGGILSIWPETHCHTLTELWAAGIPVIAFDIGAVGERIRKHGGGWLVPVNDIPLLVRQLNEIASTPGSLLKKMTDVHAWQKVAGSAETVKGMAKSYLGLYKDISNT